MPYFSNCNKFFSNFLEFFIVDSPSEIRLDFFLSLLTFREPKNAPANENF